LPEKDYLPESLEEKIASFADNMIFGSTVRDFDSFLRRLDKIDSGAQGLFSPFC
jgi:hypothetical protein